MILLRTRCLACLLAVLLGIAGMTALADEATEAAAIAGDIQAQATANEEEVTALLQSLETDSRHLTGLEHRLKSLASIARKLISNAHDMEISLKEAIPTVRDALRYTFIIDYEEYTSGVDALLKALVERGYGVARVNNTWGGDGYKGINTNLTTPGGYLFEIQFHTQDSFDAKEVKTHALYEIVRSEDSTEAEKQEAAEKQRQIFAAVPVPEGAVDYAWSNP